MRRGRKISRLERGGEKKGRSTKSQKGARKHEKERKEGADYISGAARKRKFSLVQAHGGVISEKFLVKGGSRATEVGTNPYGRE